MDSNAKTQDFYFTVHIFRSHSYLNTLTSDFNQQCHVWFVILNEAKQNEESLLIIMKFTLFIEILPSSE
ncbi:hypothetical protein AMQ68_07015 [Chryseobacterium sp. ERMR1:04]|nr:hypothetical protein AMQ68_07015 [Chryseobacterium sp. ERMR1:04]